MTKAMNHARVFVFGAGRSVWCFAEIEVKSDSVR